MAKSRSPFSIAGSPDAALIDRLELLRPRRGSRAVLAAGPRQLACAIGRSGIAAVKREGDGATPAGTMRVLSGFYRADRIRRPSSRLDLRPIAPHDGWCDDPADAAYNRLVRRPYPTSHEAMWRDDGLYDIVLVLDWNIAPRRRGRGSAIFMHCARPDYAATEGCVALARCDLKRLLAHLGPETRLVVKP